MNSRASLWIKWSKATAGASEFAHPSLTASSSVWNQPSAAIHSVSCVPAPLISVAHTICPSVRPPTFIPILSFWHPIVSIHSSDSPQPEPTPWQDCHLWSSRYFHVAIVFPCVWRWSSPYPLECLQSQPSSSVTKLDCHLLHSGILPLPRGSGLMQQRRNNIAIYCRCRHNLSVHVSFLCCISIL